MLINDITLYIWRVSIFTKILQLWHMLYDCNIIIKSDNDILIIMLKIILYTDNCIYELINTIHELRKIYFPVILKRMLQNQNLYRILKTNFLVIEVLIINKWLWNLSSKPLVSKRLNCCHIHYIDIITLHSLVIELLTFYMTIVFF